MPVIVPLLRVGLLFLNVYDTFKILKLPQRSVRTGKRTIQAMSQRKRNMKGCMCVWLVWVRHTLLFRHKYDSRLTGSRSVLQYSLSVYWTMP